MASEQDLELVFFNTKKEFLIISEKVMKYLSGDGTATALLSKLLLVYKWEKSKGNRQDWFPLTAESVENSLGINTYLQSQAIKKLESKGLIEHKRGGFKGRRFFKINYSKIYNDILFESKKEWNETKTKFSFYADLNSAETLKEYREALDKIPLNIGEFIYAFSRLMVNVHGKRFTWDSNNYGKLKYFWNNLARKPFDYQILAKWDYMLNPKEPLASFITYYSVTPEKGNRKTLTRMMKETNIFDEGVYSVETEICFNRFA